MLRIRHVFDLFAKAWGAATIAMLVVGCAGQSALKDGQALFAQGQVAAGIAKMEEASRLEPGNPDYRIRYLQARDQGVQLLLARGATAVSEQKYDLAESLYRDVLAIQGNHDKALAEIRRINNLRRWDKGAEEAATAVGQKNWDAARARLRSVLLESPQHVRAQQLLSQVERESAPPAVNPTLAASFRRPITIDFKDATLKTVFEVISRTSGLNFLFDKDVKTDQKTSIYLRNSTIEAAIELTLLTNQLEQRVLDANSILIYPSTQAKQREYQPLTVKSFYLSNAEAKTVANTLKTILKSKDVVVDEKLNLLIVRDTVDAVRLAEKLVALHDVPEAEVMLEVEILEVKKTRLMDLGVRWPDSLSLAPLPATPDGAVTLSDLRNLNTARVGATVGALTINARKNDGDTNILANPRIRVRNREKAKILIGERVPNITTTSTSTGFVADSVNYVDVGLKLEVEPVVYPDGEVAIKVALEVSSVVNQLQTKSGSVAYQIGTRNASTVLRLKDGENQVLAGLINDEDRKSAYKIPGLGEMPILGRLFGSHNDNASKTEIVLSITPRIVRNIVRPDAGTLEFDSGTEASVRRQGAVSGMGAGSATSAAPEDGVRRAPSGRPEQPAAQPGTAQPAGAGSVSGGSTGAANSVGVPSGPDMVPNNGGAGPSVTVGSVESRWQGPTQLKVGDTFALQLTVQSETPVVAVPLSVSFDPAALQVVSVTEGDFFKRDNQAGSFNSRIDPNGRVLITARAGTEAGATGGGSLLSLNMRVIGNPTPETRVQVLATSPVGVGGVALMAPLAPPHVIVLAP